jgi:pantoate--beta-alanine ligase
MGALHDGHLSIVRQSLVAGHKTVVSIFVNPTQFGPNEDFAAYPRIVNEDAQLLKAAGADVLFTPDVDEMYAHGFSTSVQVKGLTDTLCGPSRPGHFEGVATIVTKLLNQVQADEAFFGEKDWQQLQVIKRLATDLDIPTHITGAPIVREQDGLALSSRNRYLGAANRAKASLLNITLRTLAQEMRLPAADFEMLLKTASRGLTENGFVVDYLELAQADTLQPVRTLDKFARLFVAARLDTTRLIDNWPVN